jgi:hypothetical protein
MNKFMQLLATPASRLLIRATPRRVASVVASKRTPLTLLSKKRSRSTMLDGALNFFNTRVLPGHAFGQNPLPSLFKSIASKKRSQYAKCPRRCLLTRSRFLDLMPNFLWKLKPPGKPALSAAVETGRLAAG